MRRRTANLDNNVQSVVGYVLRATRHMTGSPVRIELCTVGDQTCNDLLLQVMSIPHNLTGSIFSWVE